MNHKTSTPVWRLGALAAGWTLALALPAAAVTLRIANQGDALSMDPHSLNESLQITVVENVLRATDLARRPIQTHAGAGHQLEANRAHRLAL